MDHDLLSRLRDYKDWLEARTLHTEFDPDLGYYRLPLPVWSQLRDHFPELHRDVSTRLKFYADWLEHAETRIDLISEIPEIPWEEQRAFHKARNAFYQFFPEFAPRSQPPVHTQKPQ